MVELRDSDIENRSEILFLYDAKDCDPNGDPFTGEPRFDEDTQKVMVSDVRLKRYVRDYIDKYESDENNSENPSNVIFYSSFGDTQTFGQRKESLKDLESVIDQDNPRESILNSCIDLRLFGCVLAIEGDNLDVTGSVQFKNMNRSLNRVELKTLQNTSVMSSGEKKEQGAIATSSQVPYALISTIGYVNPKTAEFNGTKEEDIQLMLEGLWNQVNLINTRTKAGQTSRILLKINYSDEKSKISDVENLIELDSSRKETEYRNFSDIEPDLDFSKFLSTVEENKNKIESIEYKYDQSQDYENLEGFIEDLKEKDIEIKEIDLENDG